MNETRRSTNCCHRKFNSAHWISGPDLSRDKMLASGFVSSTFVIGFWHATVWLLSGKRCLSAPPFMFFWLIVNERKKSPAISLASIQLWRSLIWLIANSFPDWLRCVCLFDFTLRFPKRGKRWFWTYSNDEESRKKVWDPWPFRWSCRFSEF